MIKLNRRNVQMIIVILMLILTPFSLYAQEIRYSVEVINRYPHDSRAFTQGLIFVGGFMYEGTGLYGESSLRKVRLDDGEVLQSAGLAHNFFGEGITALKGRIFQLTWQEEQGFVYDLHSFQLIDEFSYEGEGWGLTTNSEHLIMSDGSHILTFLDPQSYEIVRKVGVVGSKGPVRLLNELEYVNGEIWANVWFSHEICRIDPLTGNVLGWLDLTDLYEREKEENPGADVLNGIAYDEENGRLFVTGKLWRSVYEIQIKGLDPEEAGTW